MKYYPLPSFVQLFIPPPHHINAAQRDKSQTYRALLIRDVKYPCKTSCLINNAVRKTGLANEIMQGTWLINLSDLQMATAHLSFFLLISLKLC